MQIADNYEAKIWLGLRAGYSQKYFNSQEAEDIVQKYCNDIHQCVTITKTRFIYVDGNEPGLIIGFINYPRFPRSEAEIKSRAIELGKILMKKFNQFRVSVTTYPAVPAGTIMLENDNLK